MHYKKDLGSQSSGEISEKYISKRWEPYLSGTHVIRSGIHNVPLCYLFIKMLPIYLINCAI